jgi:1-deoxy-D-xylulose-5-phosphate reductoisomerase
MRECVQYAIDYPERFTSKVEELDLFKIGSLTFREPDYTAFPLLPLAHRAMLDGGAYGAVIEAADEVAVGAYLEEKINFGDISDVVSEIYERADFAKGCSTLEEILAAHKEAAELSKKIIKK